MTFDRIKIKANCKCLLEQMSQFNHNYNAKSGELTREYYSSKGDNRVPFNLYIATSKPRQTLTLEFSSKILGQDYPKLISKYNIRQCLENINNLGICKIDVDEILASGCITSADVAKDIRATITDETLDALSVHVRNYRRYKWDYYDKDGIVFMRDVNSAKCKESIRIYRKEKEITTSKNKDFLATLPNMWEVIKHFVGVTRFEVKLETVDKIRSYLGIKETYISEVLNTKANPILAMYDKVFSDTGNMSEMNCINYDSFAMRAILEIYNGDLKTIEMILKPFFSSRSGLNKRMMKIAQTKDESSKGSESGIDHIKEVRNLLL